MDPRRIIAVFALLTLLVTTVIVVTGSFGFLLPFLSGAVLALLNLAGTAYAWPKILDKKSIALPVGIIVSKFAITIGLLYWLMKPSAFDRLNDWFFSSVLVSNQAALKDESGGGLVNLVVFILGIALVLPAAAVAHLSQDRAKVS